ncbi:hypothetical protein O6H91_01G018000 [Diphasiastrum complanatum]|nr:hypothetical protein O6H91_01G018000 [Diphasiastrum complanatum]
MYGECGSMEEARAVFDKLPNPNLHSSTILMKAYVKNDLGKEALECFYQMQVCGIQPNRVTFIAAVDACASTANIEKGQELHAVIRERGYEGEIVVATALVNMYGKCGSLEEARAVFNTMPHRNVVSWTAMIDACARNGHGKEALELFYEMQAEGIKPNQITFLCALDACSSLAALEKAREVHASIVKSGCQQTPVIATALVNVYGKCGSLEDARFVFAQMTSRDVVSWNSMIAAFAQNGHGKEALGLFHRMRSDSIEPNHVTFLNILTACSHMGRVDDGKHYFASMSRDYGITPKVEHYLCLIDMLGRAGSLDAAEDLINSIPFKNEASVWLCLLSACTRHGDIERGIRAANHALELDPKRAAPYLLLSNMYASSGRQDDAKKHRKVWKNNN